MENERAEINFNSLKEKMNNTLQACYALRDEAASEATNELKTLNIELEKPVFNNQVGRTLYRKEHSMEA